MKLFFLISVLFLQVLTAKPIETFYGIIEVEEPVLLELIDCEAMQRLKNIHQYGVSYYTTHKENYTRYDHSLGVFAILKKNKASLKEQVAGLLHDVSHTVFSHVGDWIFGLEHAEKDYQNHIHIQFLQKYGVAKILKKHGYQIEEIEPLEELFPALECPLPDLCADRIDYNIQGAYHQGFLTYEEALLLFEDLQYIDNKWVGENKALIEKLAYFSCYMSKNCWGSPKNYLQSRWLANAIIRLKELGEISENQILFGVDNELWEMLKDHSDWKVKELMNFIQYPEAFFSHESYENSDEIIKSKFRGINPWINTVEGIFKLTELNNEYERIFSILKLKHKNGWPIKFLSCRNGETLEGI